jgi:hypothetical protein
MAEAAGNPTIDGMTTAGPWTPAPAPDATAARDRGLTRPTPNDEENRHALSR